MEGDMTDVATPGASDRIAAIRAAMTDDAEAGATFAEPVRASIAATLERLEVLVGSETLAEAGALLTHVRDRVSGLDPARLEPRGGLAGLFDGRGKRLKAFRAAYVSAADAARAGAADLTERANALGQRGGDLDAMWTELRDGLNALDEYLAVGRAWLTDRRAQLLDPVQPETAVADPLPPEAAAAFEDGASDPEASAPIEAQADAEAELAVAPSSGADAEPVSPVALAVLPHPLEARLDSLMETRAVALRRLPVIRAMQNADHAAPAALAAACQQIEAWTADWREALGMAGRRPRKVRPDATRLNTSHNAMVGALTSAERCVAAARTRWDELMPRATAAEAARAAA
jgi:hypothetical protein